MASIQEAVSLGFTGDRETLELIQQTAVKASGAVGKVQVLPLADEPPGTYGLVFADGRFERVKTERLPLSDTLGSVDQVAAYVQQMCGISNLAADSDEYVSVPVRETLVFYDEEGVQIVLDAGLHDRRNDECKVCLAYTPEFALLKKLGERTYDQKDFLRLLRIDLAICDSPKVQDLIKVCRALEFSTGATGTATVDRSRASYGRDVNEEVRSKAGEIPDTLELHARVYQDRALTTRRLVTCLVEIDIQRQQFQLIPRPCDLQQAVDAEMRSLGSLLADCPCPVYYGCA